MSRVHELVASLRIRNARYRLEPGTGNERVFADPSSGLNKTDSMVTQQPSTGSKVHRFVAITRCLERSFEGRSRRAATSLSYRQGLIFDTARQATMQGSNRGLVLMHVVLLLGKEKCYLVRESNPRMHLGKVLCYHYINKVDSASKSDFLRVITYPRSTPIHVFFVRVSP